MKEGIEGGGGKKRIFQKTDSGLSEHIAYVTLLMSEAQIWTKSTQCLSFTWCRDNELFLDDSEFISPVHH